MKPLISVLMLTYNQGDYIERSLKSVFVQKSLHYDLEIIVTDDGSSDNTAEIIRDLEACSPVPIRFIEKAHEGVTSIAKNLLSMIDASSGDYIAFLSGDDFYMPDRFFPHIKMFSLNENLKIVYSDGVNCENKELKGSCHPPKSLAVMSSNDAGRVYQYLSTQAPVLFIQGVLANGEFLRTIKPFDEDLIADDWVFNLKVFGSILKNGGGYAFDPLPRFLRNIHGDNTSRNLKVHYERVSQVAERYCRKSWIIKSRYVGNAFVTATKSKNYEDVGFFAIEMVKAPPAVFWVMKYLVGVTLKRFWF